ncbi:hypothetical protein K491DRAFT_615312, partial [Lophiostoma macrostomum CBS 122681]
IKLLPTAQLALNSAKLLTTGYSLFYANYRYKLLGPRDLYKIVDILPLAIEKARSLRAIYNNLSKQIA